MDKSLESLRRAAESVPGDRSNWINYFAALERTDHTPVAYLGDMLLVTAKNVKEMLLTRASVVKRFPTLEFKVGGGPDDIQTQTHPGFIVSTTADTQRQFRGDFSSGVANVVIFLPDEGLRRNMMYRHRYLSWPLSRRPLDEFEEDYLTYGVRTMHRLLELK